MGMAPIQVDLIVDDAGGVGGSNPKITNLVRGLSSRGIDIEVFGFRSRYVDGSYSLPVSCSLSPTSGSTILNSAILLLKSPSMPIRKGSIIHAMEIPYAVPFLWRRHPIIVEERCIPDPVMRMRHSKPVVWLYLFTERLCVTRARKVVAVAPEVAAYLRRKHGISDNKIEIIPVGVNLAEFKPLQVDRRAVLGTDAVENVILFVGRIERVKNLAFLLQAFRVVSEKRACTLVLAGTGKEEQNIRRLTSAMGIDGRVRFLGFVPHEDIPRIMSAADVFAFASLSEGSPNVTKEAIACGLPVVSVNVGDVSTYLKDDVNGYIVNAYDIRLFADRLLRAIERKDALKKNCLNMRREISLEFMIDQYCELYRRLKS